MLTEILQHLQFTSQTWVYALPLILMGVDVLTGLVNACFKEKNFQSSVMRAGLTKKVGEIAIIVVAIVLTYGIGMPKELMQAPCRSRSRTRNSSSELDTTMPQSSIPAASSILRVSRLR